MKSLTPVSIFLMGMIVFGPGNAPAQGFPNKPIRIVTCAPGGTCDFTARVVAQGLTESLGQPVIVENRGQASGLIAVQTVTKAPTDGYTLLFHSSPIWLLPFLQDNVPYDPVKDLSPISLVVSAPNVVVVHPSLPVNSIKTLIAIAKSRPGELNYSSGATGAAPHLSAELFKSMAGVNIVRIAHRGTGEAVLDLIAGRVQLMFPVVGLATPHIQAGKLRALAITSAQASALYPSLATVASQGLPGYESAGLFGLLAAAGTPDAVVSRLSQEIARLLSKPEVKERIFKSGSEAVGSTPDEFAAKIKSEMNVMGKVIKDAGIRNE